MLTVFKLNVYALVGSNIVFAVIMCVLNQRKITSGMRIQNQYTKNICKAVDRFGDYGCYNVCCSFRTSPSDRRKSYPDCFGNYRGSYCLWSPYFKIRSSFGERYSGASDGNTDIERMSGAEIDASKRRIKNSE